MCTSLLYHDAHGAPYAGRTMELPMELPYRVGYTPAHFSVAFRKKFGVSPKSLRP